MRHAGFPSLRKLVGREGEAHPAEQRNAGSPAPRHLVKCRLMGTSYEEAIAQITGPGGPFEIAEEVIRGQRLRVFKNTPPSLRSLWDLCRARGDATFLVYEDESWSWAETMRHVDALAAALVHRFGVAPGD